MNLIISSLPDDSAELPIWLDRQIVGLNLRELVSELAAVHGATSATTTTLDDALGPYRERVLAEGLKALPKDVLKRLLKDPILLFEIQDLVIAEGGEYWLSLQPSAEHAAAVQRGRERLKAIRDKAVRRSRWPGLLSVAALLLVCVGIGLYVRYGRPRPAEVTQTEVAWGWCKPSAFSSDVPRSAYLNRLTNEAGEWFDQRPTSTKDVIRRVAQFREGCANFIGAVHSPLAIAERTEIRARCQKWAAQLDDLMQQLNSGKDPISVRDAADEIVRKLQKFLRDQASS